MKSYFNLHPTGSETYFYNNPLYGKYICSSLQHIFKDTVSSIELKNVEYVYQNKCEVIITFNEGLTNKSELDKIKKNIKYILEKVACANQVDEGYELFKHVIKINNNSFYEYINNKVNNNLDKEYLVTESFNLYTGDSVSITSFYYLS